MHISLFFLMDKSSNEKAKKYPFYGHAAKWLE